MEGEAERNKRCPSCDLTYPVVRGDHWMCPECGAFGDVVEPAPTSESSAEVAPKDPRTPIEILEDAGRQAFIDKVRQELARERMSGGEHLDLSDDQICQCWVEALWKRPLQEPQSATQIRFARLVLAAARASSGALPHVPDDVATELRELRDVMRLEKNARRTSAEWADILHQLLWSYGIEKIAVPKEPSREGVP